MSNVKESPQLAQAISKIFIWSKISLLCPLKQTGLALSLSYLALLLGIIPLYLLSCAYYFYLLVNEIKFSHLYNSLLSFAVVFAITSVVGILPVLSHLWYLANKKYLQNILYKVNSIDLHLAKSRTLKVPTKHRNKMFYYIFILLCSVSNDMFMNFKKRSRASFEDYLLFYVTRIYLFIITDQICGFLDLVIYRYYMICLEVTPKIKANLWRKQKNLENLVVVEEKLVDLCEDLNIFYAPHLFLIICFTWVNLIDDMFSVVLTLKDMENVPLVKQIVRRVIKFLPCWDIMASFSIIKYKVITFN